MDLSFLLPLYARPGPFATAYVDVSRTTEAAAHRVTLEWRRTREALLEQGASRPTVLAMDEAVALSGASAGPGVPEPHTQVVVGAGGRVLLNDEHPGRAAAGRSSWAPLPDLLPMLAAAPLRVPYLVARVDCVGADLMVFESHDAELGGVRGTYPIRKVGPGGWSQRRYQQRAENLWAANARQVAEQVERLARRHRTRLIVLAGDVRAKSALTQALSEESQAELVDVEGGRAVDVDDEAMWASAHQAVADHGAGESRRLLDRFDAERGRHGVAVEGLSSTIAALHNRQVDVLFVNSAGVQRTVLVGPEPLDLAGSKAHIADEAATPVRADAALVRAGAANRARLVTVNAAVCALHDGVAALLRYDSRP